MYYAWRRGYDITSGLLLGLATSYKVTPALFFVYFAYKRSWRTVGWGLLGLGIFLVIVPSAVIGTEFNGECLGMWWHRMITPFVVKGATSPQVMNQSLSGVLSRLLTEMTPGHGRYDAQLRPQLGLLAALDCQLPDQGCCALAAGTARAFFAGPRRRIGAIRGCSAKSPWWFSRCFSSRSGAGSTITLRSSCPTVISFVSSSRRVSGRDLECCLSAHGRCHLS